jgi:hypothetical protein
MDRVKEKPVPRGKERNAAERLRELEEEYRELASRLADIGPVHDGTVTRQMLTCGNEKCACHRDRSRRHGPYAYWTTKVKGKTVSRRLSPEEADLVEEWIRNRRQLDKAKKQLVALSKKMLPLVLETRAKERA